MTFWQAIVLGIVQGLTEYLPISSTAHLAIVPRLLGWPNPDLSFKAIIQLGTLGAVFWYFRKDIVAIARSTLSGQSRLGWYIVAGTVPVLLAGKFLKGHIVWMNGSLLVMACAMIGVGVVLAVAECVERRRLALRGLDQVGWRDAIGVGLAQVVALIPGSSRSGCTIAGGLFLGLNRETAARFSFLLSLPALLAAGLYELRDVRLDDTAQVLNLVAATAVAGVVGYASIAFLLGYLRNHTMWLFILYRFGLGALLLVLLATGYLAP